MISDICLFFQKKDVGFKEYILSLLGRKDKNNLSLTCKNLFLMIGNTSSIIIYKTITGEFDFSKVEKDFDLTHRNYIYLFLSVKFNHYENANFLLSYPGIVKESLGPEYIYSTVEEGHLEMLKLLIKYGVDPSVNDSHALIRAVKHNKLKIVRFLVKDDRINLRSYHGRAIKDACINGREMMIRAMLKSELELPDLYICIEKAHRYPNIQELIIKKINQ